MVPKLLQSNFVKMGSFTKRVSNYLEKILLASDNISLHFYFHAKKKNVLYEFRRFLKNIFFHCLQKILVESFVTSCFRKQSREKFSIKNLQSKKFRKHLHKNRLVENSERFAFKIFSFRISKT